MKKQVGHISIFQSSKVLAVLSAIMVGLFTIPAGIIFMLNGHSRNGLFLMLYPFLFLVFIFIAHSIFFWLYNLFARSFGGVEFTFKDPEEGVQK